ncbi:hypothetical protein [Actinomadura macra]|uniref:hypothetical protein n=1 Tax=Actinomadura macra TaxID=46164 RepID=UPI000ADA9032|nr:hypothetical protein [Actinomadura macra]
MPDIDFILVRGLAALLGAIVQGSVGLGWAFGGVSPGRRSAAGGPAGGRGHVGGRPDRP